MVIKRHGKMVANQILSRASEIHRVPIFKLIAKALENIFADLAALWVSTLLENVLPNIIIEILCLEAKGAWLLTIKV